MRMTRRPLCSRRLPVAATRLCAIGVVAAVSLTVLPEAHAQRRAAQAPGADAARLEADAQGRPGGWVGWRT